MSECTISFPLNHIVCAVNRQSLNWTGLITSCWFKRQIDTRRRKNQVVWNIEMTLSRMLVSRLKTALSKADWQKRSNSQQGSTFSKMSNIKFIMNRAFINTVYRTKSFYTVYGHKLLWMLRLLVTTERSCSINDSLRSLLLCTNPLQSLWSRISLWCIEYTDNLMTECHFLSSSHTRGWARGCTNASRRGWTRGSRSMSPATWTPRPTSGWWAKAATAYCLAPPAASRRSFTSWTSTSTESNTACPARRRSRGGTGERDWFLGVFGLRSNRSGVEGGMRAY